MVTGESEQILFNANEKGGILEGLELIVNINFAPTANSIQKMYLY